MTTDDLHRSQALAALAEARRALQSGHKNDARRLALQAAALAPDLEDPWLVLAAVASPRASQAYLLRALEINPNSARARRGLEWAAKRAVEETQAGRPARPEPPAQPSAPARPAPAQRAEALPAPDIVYRPSVDRNAPDTVVYQVAEKAPRRRRAVRLALAAVFLLACLALSAWVFVRPAGWSQAGLPPQAVGWADAARLVALRQVGGLAGYAPRLGLRDFPATAAAIAPAAIATATAANGAAGDENLLLTPGASGGAELTPAVGAGGEGNLPPVPVVSGAGEALPTPFAPLTDTPTPTITPTPTVTPTPTETPLPTATPLPTDTATPLPPPTDVPPPPTQTAPPELQPTRKPKKPKAPQVDGPAQRPAGVEVGERWIDVDLSTQMTYAMEGDTAVNQFLVSTGRWPTVTVTGVYKIYVKYRAADMSGADYYLQDVPYVMYFYEGYGIHGTYWHNNFGTPMSHGCVNLRPVDAGWLFEFARVGTVVNVHQ